MVSEWQQEYERRREAYADEVCTEMAEAMTGLVGAGASAARAALNAHVARLVEENERLREALERAVSYLPGVIHMQAAGSCEHCGGFTRTVALRFCIDCEEEHVTLFARRALATTEEP